MIAGKEKMDFVAGQMGQTMEVVSTLRSKGKKNSTGIVEVSNRNKKHVENMHMTVGELVALVGDRSMTARRVSNTEVKTPTTAANKSLSASDKILGTKSISWFSGRMRPKTQPTRASSGIRSRSGTAVAKTARIALFLSSLSEAPIPPVH